MGVTFEQIKEILKGIDCEETSHKDGWWETSTGAKFGKEKLNEIANLFHPIATPYKKRSLGEEIEVCKKYYERLKENDG